MIVFLCVIVALGIALEIFACTDGLKHVLFDYKTSAFSAEPGEEINVTTTVVNTGILPISYIKAEIAYPVAAELPEGTEYRESRFNTLVFDSFRLWGKQKKERTLTVSLSQRGVHYFNGASFYRGDFIGIKEVGEEYPKNYELLIFPERFSDDTLNEALGSFYGDMLAERSLLQDPIITAGIREYTGYEPMKTISWTQSARRGELMVREFDYTKELNCSVVLCTNGIQPLDGERMDRCCSIARTVCENLTERGINIEFYTNAPLMGVPSERVQSCSVSAFNTENLLEILARVYAAARTKAEELVGTVIRASANRCAYVLIIPEETSESKIAEKALYEFSGVKPLVLNADTFINH